MADESVTITPPAAGELSTEQQLDALFAQPTEGAKKGEVSSPPPPTETKEAKDGEEAPKLDADGKPIVEKPEPTLDELLETIEKPTEEAKGALTPEQKTVLDAIPSPEVLENVTAQLGVFRDFNSALASGDIKTVETMIKQGSPAWWDAIVEHVYQQCVEGAKEDDPKNFLTRWLSENEPGGKAAKGATAATRALEAKLNDLQNKMGTKEAAERQAEQNRVRLEAKAKYDSYLEGLFDQIKFAKGDRKWVTAEIFNRVVSSPQVRAAINQGNLKAVNPVFTAAVKEYVSRDKDAKETVEVKLKAQEQKKVLGGGTGNSETSGSDDYATAKTPEEIDGVMNRKLAKLFAK